MNELLTNSTIGHIQQTSLSYGFEIGSKDCASYMPHLSTRSVTLNPEECKIGDIFLGCSEFETKKKLIPERIIFNPPATIVFWNDGTKTVVKAAEDTEFNHYWGFCSALAIKMFGSNHAVKSMIRKNCNVKLDKQLTPIVEA